MLPAPPMGGPPMMPMMGPPPHGMMPGGPGRKTFNVNNCILVYPQNKFNLMHSGFKDASFTGVNKKIKKK